MKPVLIVTLCLIALCCALPVDEEHEREKRSSSGERGGYGMPSYYPYYVNNGNSNGYLNYLLPFLLARLLPAAAAPAPAPAPAPAGK